MGKIFRFYKDVDTDQIIASQYLLYPTIDEMKSHTFESLDPNFASAVQPGDYVVADENFGCGSSREQAPSVLKALGVKAVVAKSFARIFYRNSINIGLPVIVCKDLYDAVEAGDDMELDMEAGIIRSGEKTFTCTSLPENLQKILNQGGLIASLNEEV
ncbi:MAG: 3-isopropylmalate dehydratase small subunit [Clostridia bacterium]|nr:3-isopropylmalate dehydratase small subunit [Clostridia bacterium]